MIFSVSFVSGNARESGRCLEAVEERGMAAVISVCETLYITLYIIMYTCTVGCTVSPTAASNKRNPGQGLLAGRCELCADSVRLVSLSAVAGPRLTVRSYNRHGDQSLANRNGGRRSAWRH